MKEQGKRVPRRWRIAAVLALGAVIGTMLVATPAQAHFVASISHIGEHMKNLFFTKSQSDARYVRASGVLTIPGVAFVETRAADPTSGSCVPESIAGDGTYYAPVYLPQAARVTKLTYHWWDANAGADATASLVRLAIPSTSAAATMASTSSAADNADHTSSSTTSITTATINNKNFAYFVRVTQPGSICIDAVQIQYKRP
jgi:hypothetical protein